MIKDRIFIFENIPNIMIAILIVIILFLTGRAVASQNYIVEQNIEHKQISIPNEALTNKNNYFFAHVIDQVLPASNNYKYFSVGEKMKKLIFSTLNQVFPVDFKNPTTFVQVQFPVLIQLKSARETLSSEVENKKQLLEDIYLVDYENEEISAQNNNENKDLEKNNLNDNDDLGELEQGVYLIGSDVVDSITNAQNLILSDIKIPPKIRLDKGKPHILIYHTHGTESYSPASEGNYHSLRREHSVLIIGEIIAEELEKRGFNVIHDITYHDYPSYSGSYTRSLSTAQKILKENPSIKIVLDVHRDGYDHIDTNPNRGRIIENNIVKINGERCTRFQFVIGPAAENRHAVEEFATFIKAVSDIKYPGFSKHILVKPYGKFNQFLSDYYALLEVGSNANTIEEAKRTAIYLADVLADSFDLIKD